MASLQVVLYQPENPYNTGAVARTCALFGADLHLVGPYGFASVDRDVRRASMGYLDQVALVEHCDWSDFVVRTATSPIFAMWDEGTTDLGSVRLDRGTSVVFGQESIGLPAHITSSYPTVRIPMPGIGELRRADHRVHSLNLSVSVGIVLHAAWQSQQRGDSP